MRQRQDNPKERQRSSLARPSLTSRYQWFVKYVLKPRAIRRTPISMKNTRLKPMFCQLQSVRQEQRKRGLQGPPAGSPGSSSWSVDVERQGLDDSDGKVPEPVAPAEAEAGVLSQHPSLEHGDLRLNSLHQFVHPLHLEPALLQLCHVIKRQSNVLVLLCRRQPLPQDSFCPLPVDMWLVASPPLVCSGRMRQREGCDEFVSLEQVHELAHAVGPLRQLDLLAQLCSLEDDRLSRLQQLHPRLKLVDYSLQVLRERG
eukprot:764742-Hanusia_phi.AAC.1